MLQDLSKSSSEFHFGSSIDSAYLSQYLLKEGYSFVFQKQFSLFLMYFCVLGLFLEMEEVLTDLYTIFHLFCGEYIFRITFYNVINMLRMKVVFVIRLKCSENKIEWPLYKCLRFNNSIEKMDAKDCRKNKINIFLVIEYFRPFKILPD